jgi:hypothetical chaperone protein
MPLQSQRSNLSRVAIGIDFGTTNSSVALAAGSPGADVRLVSFATPNGVTESYRSILYLQQLKEGARSRLHSSTGPDAIEAYLHAEHSGRLIQSLKSWLTSRTLTGTEIFGRRYTLENLIARILGDLRQHAEKAFGVPVRQAVVGRPVRFVGAETAEDDAFGEGRLRAAFEHAGFEQVEFELEPVGAAYHYESTLDHDELILIGDFGGGTSDFSLLRVGPGIRKRGRTAVDLMGNSGVGLAGDAFDAKIVRNLVSPRLGLGTMERSVGKVLPAVPNWVYAKLEHWHHLSFLRTRAVVEMLHGARTRAFEPEKIQALQTLIDEDLGYQLHRAVGRVKMELSSAKTAEFHFRDGTLDIRATVQRRDFESWIAEELAAIERSVDGLLATSGVAAGDVDRVFLTGGSSFVPAVRRIFETRFGAERVVTGNEFTSVARGLALRALECLTETMAT